MWNGLHAVLLGCSDVRIATSRIATSNTWGTPEGHNVESITHAVTLTYSELHADESAFASVTISIRL